MGTEPEKHQPGDSSPGERMGEGDVKKLRNLSVTERLIIFERVIELRKQGICYSKIQQKILEEFCVLIAIGTIDSWARGIKMPYRNRPFDEIVGPELSYIIGAVLGDGWVYHYINRNKYQMGYVIKLGVKAREFAEEFARCLTVVLRKDKPIRPIKLKNGIWDVRAYDIGLYLLLKDKDINKIRRFVEHSEECIRAFIRGFADAEGCVNPNAGIIIANTNKDFIQYVAGLLQRIGISFKIYEFTLPEKFLKDGKVRTRRHKTIYNIVIRRKDDVRLFGEIIGFTIRRKQERLKILMQLAPLERKNIRKIPMELRMETYETARQLYEQGYSLRKIQRELREKYGASPSREAIRRWVKGICAPHGENAKRLPIELRAEMYKTARKLYTEGYSITEVKRKLTEKYGALPGYATIWNWSRGIRAPWKRGGKVVPWQNNTKKLPPSPSQNPGREGSIE